MSEGEGVSTYKTCKDMNHVVIVSLGTNKDKAELLRTLILSNENLTENTTRLEADTCGMQVSVIDTVDIAREDDVDNKLASDWKSVLPPDNQYLYALVLTAEHGKVSAEDKSTLSQFRAMFEEHAEKNVVLAVFSIGEVGKLCGEDDTILGQMLDQGRYIVFNEKTKGSDFMGKLKELGHYHNVVPPQSNDKQTKVKRKPSKSETETTATLKGPAIQVPATHELQKQREEASTMPIDPSAKRSSFDVPRPDLTIVLLGQSGSGKSASGNTILGRQVFESHLSSMPVTTQCQAIHARIFGIPVRVIDTPDFFNEDVKNRDEAKATCKNLCSTGHVVYLLVMQLGRFTDGERQILPQIKDMLGQDVVQKTIILFTFKNDLKKGSLKDYIDNTDPGLKDLIKCCGSRYHAFNNNDKSSKQVSELFDIIVDMQKEYLNITEVYPKYKNKSENKDCTIL